MTVVSTKLKYSIADASGVVGQQQFKEKARFDNISQWKYVDKLNKLAEFSFTTPVDEFSKANAIIERKITVPLLKPFIGLITKKSINDVSISLSAKEFATHLQRRIYTNNDEKDIVYTDEDWLDPSWKYRRKIIINKDFISDDLPEFVLQIHNKHEADEPHKKVFPAFTDGRDFRVTMPDGKTVIPYEIEFWDQTANEFVIRFKLPVVKKGVEQIAYLYYGNSGASDSQTVTSAWSNNFIAVYHFQEDPGVGNYKDSVSNGSLNSGVPTNITKIIGHHGNGADFNGTSSKIDCGSHTSLDDMWAGGGAVDWWMKPDSDGEGDSGRIIDKGSWRIYVRDEVSGLVRVRFEHDFSTTGGVWETDRLIPFTSDTTIAIEYNRDSTTNNPVFYMNGEKITTNVITTPVGTATSDAASNLIIGNNTGQTATFDGWIDEVELHSVIRGDNWWRSRYRNETMDANVKPFFLLFKNQEYYKTAANVIAQNILDSANIDMPSGVTWVLGAGFPTDVVSISFHFLNHYEALNELSFVLGKDLFFDNKTYEVFIGTKGKTIDPDEDLDIVITSEPEQNTDNFANILDIIGKTDDRGKSLESIAQETTPLRFNYEKVVQDDKITEEDHLTKIGDDLLNEFKDLSPQIKGEIPLNQLFRFALQSGDIIKISQPKKNAVGDFRVMEITAEPTKVNIVLENTDSAIRRLRSRSLSEIIEMLINQTHKP